MCGCVRDCSCGYVSVAVGMCVRGCVYVRGCVFVCGCVYVCGCWCGSACVYVCVCCAFACMFLCLFVYHVYLCVCLPFFLKFLVYGSFVSKTIKGNKANSGKTRSGPMPIAVKEKRNELSLESSFS